MSETALVGRFAKGPVDLPVLVGSTEFLTLFGSVDPQSWPAEIQARQFFANGGAALHIVRVQTRESLVDDLIGNASTLSGLHALEPLSNLRLLIAPELSRVPPAEFNRALLNFREFLEPRRIFLILDPPPGLASASAMVNWVQSSIPTDAGFAAVYFPYLDVGLSIDGMQARVGPSGAMAAIYQKSDASAGIWNSPAGTLWPLAAASLSPPLNTADADLLNVNHVNSIRQFAGIGIIPFGARTLDRVNSENRFISVVRTRNWVEGSLQRALAFTATNDNTPALWTSIRAMTENFLHSLYQQGALLGSTPQQSYFARCDATTTTATDVAAHLVRLLYGVALIQPAEFDVALLTSETHDSTRAAPEPAMVLRVAKNEINLAFPTVPGFDYTLEVSRELEPARWDPVGGPTYGDGAWRRVTAAADQDSGFYRIRIHPAR
jgi:hypothetical protein